MRRVRVESSGGVSVCVAEVADSHWTRFWGLMGRKHLPDGFGIWIQPSSSVHTFFMRFPIDLVYLGGGNEVVKVCPQVKPWHLSFGGRGAKTVLELAQGALDRVHLNDGEKLTMRPVELKIDAHAQVPENSTQGSAVTEEGTP